MVHTEANIISQVFCAEEQKSSSIEVVLCISDYRVCHVRFFKRTYFKRLWWILKNLISNLRCTKCSTINFEKFSCRTPCIAEEGLKWLKNGRCMEFLIWKAIDETNGGCFYLNGEKMIRILHSPLLAPL